MLVDYVPTELTIPVLLDAPVLVNGYEAVGTGLAYYHASQINPESDFYPIFVLKAQFSLVSGLDTQTPSEDVVRTWLELIAPMIDWKLPKDELYAALLAKYGNWTTIHRWISEAFIQAALWPTKGKEDTVSKVIERNRYMQEKDTYALVQIGALTGEISAQGYYNPPKYTRRFSVTRLWPLEKALSSLAEGGYVIDKRPLAEFPEIESWIWQAPLPDGRIGGDVDRASAQMRESAARLGLFVEGTMEGIAYAAANKIGEPDDGSAGPMDYVPAEYLARYWWTRGARVGRRDGDIVRWTDGEEHPVCGWETYLKGTKS